ncbi:MAG: protoporphyrinogen oxidase [Opitutaceae bacterium]
MNPPSHTRPAGRLPVAVLGAGITGLSAAWNLRQAGIPAVVFEATGRCGGAIETIREGGWLHEAGPNSLLEGRADDFDLLADLGIGARRLFAAEAAKNRYVLRNGRMEPMPASPGRFLCTRLFSWRAKLGLAGEVFRPRGNPSGDETVADFTVRRLGREFLDYAVDPFVGGVYAGDPARLSVRHAFPRLFALEREHGSLIRGAVKLRNASGGPRGRIMSFPEGLEELPRAIAARLGDSLRLRTPVHALGRGENGWRVAFGSAGAARQEEFSAVICALPADALARLRLEGFAAPDLLAPLSGIEHPPVASVFTGFRRGDVAHALDGFGVLVPRVEGRTILGTLFSSTLFPGRAPDGHVALTTFVGGTRQPELALLDDAALAALVQSELVSLLGVRAAPVFLRVHRHPRAIPQYGVGFDRFEAIFSGAESSAPGLYFGGNSRDGVALSSCIASGRRLAQAAAARR